MGVCLTCGEWWQDGESPCGCRPEDHGDPVGELDGRDRCPVCLGYGYEHAADCEAVN